MSKTQSSLRNMLIALFMVTAISATALGFVYELTKEPIELAKKKKKQDAIKAVTPEFDNDPDAERIVQESGSGEMMVIYPARQNGELVGAAVETYTNKGYSGLIKVMVGFKPDGTILNYSILEHKETPGLGSKMDPWFRSENGDRSIIGKNPSQQELQVKNDGGGVDAITAATISSRAFLEAVNLGYKTFKEGGLDNE